MQVFTDKTVHWHEQNVPHLDHDFFLLQVQGLQGLEMNRRQVVGVRWKFKSQLEKSELLVANIKE